MAPVVNQCTVHLSLFKFTQTKQRNSGKLGHNHSSQFSSAEMFAYFRDCESERVIRVFVVCATSNVGMR